MPQYDSLNIECLSTKPSFLFSYVWYLDTGRTVLLIDEEYQVKTDPLNIDHLSADQLSVFPWVVFRDWLDCVCDR